MERAEPGTAAIEETVMPGPRRAWRFATHQTIPQFYDISIVPMPETGDRVVQSDMSRALDRYNPHRRHGRLVGSIPRPQPGLFSWSEPHEQKEGR
jgi:hypothetical protein